MEWALNIFGPSFVSVALNVPPNPSPLWEIYWICEYNSILESQPNLWYTSGKQTPTLTLRLGLELSFLTKLLIKVTLKHPFSHAAIGLDYWGASHDAPLLTLLSLLSMYTWHY